MSQAELLSAKVRAVNNANKTANRLCRELIEIFKPLVGTKVRKEDGLTIKCKSLLPNISRISNPNLHIYFRLSDYTLNWVVRATEYTEYYTSCHEVSCTIGELHNKVLTKMVDEPCQYREDYTVEEILEKRRICWEARRCFEEAQSNLYPFGES